MNTSDSILATIDSLNEINESIYGSYNLEDAFQTILEKSANTSHLASPSLELLMKINKW